MNPSLNVILCLDCKRARPLLWRLCAIIPAACEPEFEQSKVNLPIVPCFSSPGCVQQECAPHDRQKPTNLCQDLPQILDVLHWKWDHHSIFLDSCIGDDTKPRRHINTWLKHKPFDLHMLFHGEQAWQNKGVQIEQCSTRLTHDSPGTWWVMPIVSSVNVNVT